MAPAAGVGGGRAMGRRYGHGVTDWLGPRGRDGGIDRIPLPDGVGGALWLCGKHAIGPDPEAALGRCGASTVVCLNLRGELADRYPGYVAWLDEATTQHAAVWFPIDDLHAPPLAQVRPLLDELRRRLDAGEALLVHCGAGIGRAGTIAAALLIDAGSAAEAALRTVAAHRPMAGPEAGAQEQLIAELEGARTGAAGDPGGPSTPA